jgi:uroporphyrin-III C-methyltransferase
LLVEKAQQGKQVVRLKGGDPFVFGRGAEEALYCLQHGVQFEIVPGVSSSIAAPAYAGVSVTHRDLASAFTVFTGHEHPDKPENTIDYSALASAAKLGTLVMLMGAVYLEQLVQHMLAAGLDPNTPAMSVEWGTTDKQRVVVATLQTLPSKVQEAGLGSPLTTVIGKVVNLREDGLRWFD